MKYLWIAMVPATLGFALGRLSKRRRIRELDAMVEFLTDQVDRGMAVFHVKVPPNSANLNPQRAELNGFAQPSNWNPQKAENTAAAAAYDSSKKKPN